MARGAGRLAIFPIGKITSDPRQERAGYSRAHDKTGVLCRDREIGLTAGRPPSTHILKLPIARVDEPIANEAYCMALAAGSGLEVAPPAPRRVAELEVKPGLVLRRIEIVVARVRSAQEEARHRLPTAFHDRPIIDRIDATIEERAERLLKARGEEP